MSAARSAKILSCHTILFGVCITCAFISILILVVLGFFVFQDYKMTGNFYETTCKVHNITSIGKIQCQFSRGGNGTQEQFSCYKIFLTLINDVRPRDTKSVLFSSVKRIETNQECSHSDCNEGSLSVDSFVRIYRNKLRSDTQFTCFYLATNPYLVIPYKKYRTMDIVHCLVWPSVSALLFITCAFLVYYDPCHLRTGKQKTNLRRVSAMILNKGNRRHKTTGHPDDIEALRPITHPVQQRKKLKNHKKEQSKFKSSGNDKGSLLQTDGPKTRIVYINQETDRNSLRKNRHPHGSDAVVPRKSHHKRRKPRTQHGSSDGSGESGKRHKMTSSSETSEHCGRKRVKTRHKRTASEPTRTPSFLRETNL